ncbi:MAG: hypothetical protein ABIO24_08115 [Saprospiraceae bacterium]
MAPPTDPSIVTPILNRLQSYQYQDLKGLNLDLVIPLEKGFLNFCLKILISHQDDNTGIAALKGFNSIVFDSIEPDKFVVKIDHKSYFDKTVEGRFLAIEYDTAHEPILVIELLKGLDWLEKGAITVVNTAKKVWDFFKTTLAGQPEPKLLAASHSAYEITSHKITLHLKQLLKNSTDFAFLTPIVQWQAVETGENRIFIKFKIKA